jgi:hypothetical protein
MSNNDGVEQRAQIATETFKGLLVINGGALIASHPYEDRLARPFGAGHIGEDAQKGCGETLARRVLHIFAQRV